MPLKACLTTAVMAFLCRFSARIPGSEWQLPNITPPKGWSADGEGCH